MDRPANRLLDETSPYLQQHAHDPVQWYPWGPNALEQAQRQNRPIFLSIGYSACHGCHVMARESFADERVAQWLNEHYVPIKVDREERGDLDEIYLRAVRELGGETGWPLSVFLTPEGAPFWGGSYLPVERTGGRPGLLGLLATFADAWRLKRHKLLGEAKRVASALARDGERDTRGTLDRALLDRSLERLAEHHDPIHGGFGPAPKFPRATDLRLLLRHALRAGGPEPLAMVTRTLDAISRGGIHDHLGGGFHRYSTDERWVLPHFEKMLAENALLVPAYLEAYALTGKEEYACVAQRACEWALREMRTEEGAFASALAAQTDNVEGLFYTWTVNEIETELGAQCAARAQAWFGLDSEGHLPGGRNVLWRERPARELAGRLQCEPEALQSEMERASKQLFVARERRRHPARDDKLLTGANALMVSALAHSFQVSGAGHHLDAARLAQRVLLDRMRYADGSLAATRCAGRNRGHGRLVDWAYTIQACIDLYESDFDRDWIAAALALDELVTQRFLDRERGGYFDTCQANEPLLAHLKSPQDGALPSGYGVQILNLLRLAELSGRRELAQRAEQAIVGLAGRLNAWPAGFGQVLMAVDFLASGPIEIALAGRREDPELQRMLSSVRARFHPQRVVALRTEDEDAQLIRLLDGRSSADGSPRAWVCQHWSCRAALRTARELDEFLE